MSVFHTHRRLQTGDNDDKKSTTRTYITPVKSGPQTSYGNNRWEVYSPKLNRSVTLYSNLEYDHWVLIEANHKIKTFCEQPLKIRIKLPIGVVTTIFDMWIKWKSGEEEFREIKYSSDLTNLRPTSRVNRQISAQKRWCEIKSIKHSVVTEETIRSDLAYLSNWKLILRYLSNSRELDSLPYSEEIYDVICEKGSISMGEIEKILSRYDSMTLKNTIFKLLYLGRISASLYENPIDMKTILEITPYVK